MKRLIDDFGIQTIAIDVTYGCNLRCLHCYNESGNPNYAREELLDGELLSLAKVISQMKPQVICICGGEPLLRKQIILEFTRIITQATNGATQVNMVTNGVLLSPQVALELKNAGISSVQVSLDGPTVETHEWLRNKPGVFKNALDAIRNLLDVGLSVNIACCPNTKNIHMYQQLVDLCITIGVDDLRVQPLMVTGRAKEFMQNYVPSFLEYRDLVRFIQKHNKKIEHPVKISWGDPLEHLLIAEQSNPITTFFNITSYGDITLSPYIPLALGNIQNHSLEEYWENGLQSIWNKRLTKDFAMLLKDCDDMDILSLRPNLENIMKDGIISLDLIDNISDFDLNLDELEGHYV